MKRRKNKKKAKEYNVKDGEWLQIGLQNQKPFFRGHAFSVCCDCGLRHHFIYDVLVERGKPTLFVQAWRDDVGTWYNRNKK